MPAHVISPESGRRRKGRGAKGGVSVHAPEPTPSILSGLSARDNQLQNDDVVIKASLWVNMLLLVGKALACAWSSSPAILASLVDSTVDVLVQAALFWASMAARRGATSSMYPAGRGQLEPVSVVVCAALKCAGMVAVFCESAAMLYAGDLPSPGESLRRHEREGHGIRHIWRQHWETVLMYTMLSLAKLCFCTWCELVVRGGRGTTTETARAVLTDNFLDMVLSVGTLIALVCFLRMCMLLVCMWMCHLCVHVLVHVPPSYTHPCYWHVLMSSRRSCHSAEQCWCPRPHAHAYMPMLTIGAYACMCPCAGAHPAL